MDPEREELVRKIKLRLESLPADQRLNATCELIATAMRLMGSAQLRQLRESMAAELDPGPETETILNTIDGHMALRELADDGRIDGLDPL